MYKLISTIEKFTGLRETSGDAVRLGVAYPNDQTTIEVRKCLIALYPSKLILSEAVRHHVNLIVSYMIPASWNFNRITDDLRPKIRSLLENRITLYVLPERWVNIKSGLIQTLTEIFNLQMVGSLSFEDEVNGRVQAGFICQTTTRKMTFGDLLLLIKNKMGIHPIRYSGSEETLVSRIGVILGNRLTPAVFRHGKLWGIDTIICSNATFQTERMAEDLEINLIDVTEYTINLGLLKLTQLLQMTHKDVEFTFKNLKSSFKIMKNVDLQGLINAIQES